MNDSTYSCPCCKGSNFKRWELPHPIVLHWILNPALAFNEIVFGQRLPKCQLICQDCDGALLERAYIPCPSCRTMHYGRLVSGKRGFKNWRGLACPSCGERIPCVWNVFSLLFLLLTFPLWALPYFLYYRKRPLNALYDAQEDPLPPERELTKKTWIHLGLGWGAAMWLFMSVMPLLTGGDLDKVWRSALIGLPIWALAGFGFGFLMWFILGRKSDRAARVRGTAAAPPDNQ